MSNAEKMSHVDKVKAEFLAEIEERGIEHAFVWIAGWFGRLGHAKVEDELARRFGDNPDQDQLGAFLLEELMRRSGMASNQSTGEGTNLLRDAELVAYSYIMSRRWHGFAGLEEIQRIRERPAKLVKTEVQPAAH